MRILYVLPAVKHPLMRGELRHYHLLRILGGRHAVTLLALSKTAVPAGVLEELGRYTERIVLFDASIDAPASGGASLRRRFASARRFRRAVREMRHAVGAIAGTGAFDVALLHGIRIHGVLDGAPALPAVIDMCDAASLRLRRGLLHGRPAELPLRLLRYGQARWLEARLRARSEHLGFISRRDRDVVIGGRNTGTVVPNGVDLGYWTRRSDAAGRSLIFTGVLDYPPNADAALHLVTRLLPAIRHSVPDVDVVIAGHNPSSELVRAAAAQPGVVVTGFVDDLRPYLERAAVFVAPLRFASGMQNKLLEAMAMELPVVTTGIAADGLKVDDGEPPVRVAERVEDLAAHVVDLLGDADARRRLGTLGRAFVCRHFDWEHAAQQFERMCVEAIAGASPEQGDARAHPQARSRVGKSQAGSIT